MNLYYHGGLYGDIRYISDSITNSLLTLHNSVIIKNIIMKFIIVSALLLGLTHCISFYAKEGVEKCFSDEVPSQTV